MLSFALREEFHADINSPLKGIGEGVPGMLMGSVASLRLKWRTASARPGRRLLRTKLSEVMVNVSILEHTPTSGIELPERGVSRPRLATLLFAKPVEQFLNRADFSID